MGNNKKGFSAGEHSRASIIKRLVDGESRKRRCPQVKKEKPLEDERDLAEEILESVKQTGRSSGAPLPKKRPGELADTGASGECALFSKFRVDQWQGG